jgi:hypothetical protein
MAGMGAMIVYCASSLLTSDTEVVENIALDKKATVQKVIENLKGELRRSFALEPEHDP